MGEARRAGDESIVAETPLRLRKDPGDRIIFIALTAQLALIRPVPAIAKKTGIPKKPGNVEVDFRSPPREILHFNQYAVEKAGEFFQISLWYFDSFNVSIPVFRGLIWQTDLNGSIEGLKRYIVKIGPGSTEERNSGRPPIWHSPPISFNILDCVSRDNCSEIVIRNFSHKSVMEASNSNTPVIGTTQGIYVSARSVHQSLVMDLISEFSCKK